MSRHVILMKLSKEFVGDLPTYMEEIERTWTALSDGTLQLFAITGEYDLMALAETSMEAEVDPAVSFALTLANSGVATSTMQAYDRDQVGAALGEAAAKVSPMMRIHFADPNGASA